MLKSRGWEDLPIIRQKGECLGRSVDVDSSLQASGIGRHEVHRWRVINEGVRVQRLRTWA